MMLAQKMKKDSIHKILLAFMIPAVMTTVLLLSRYMIDSFFACRISDECIIAVNTTFPLIAFIQALGYWVGMGTGSIYSKKIGQKDATDTQLLIRCGWMLSLFIGIGVAVVCYLRPQMMLSMIGIGDDHSAATAIYVRWIAYATVFSMLGYYFENILRAMGHLNIVLISVIGSIACNILTNVLLLKMHSIKSIGAGFTVGQAVYMLLLILFYNKMKAKDGSIKQQNKDSNATSRCVAMISILWIGIPSLIRQGIGCVYFALVNHITQSFSQQLQTALAVANKAGILVFAIAIGCSQASQPMIGYLCGAKKVEKVKEVYLKSIKYGTIGLVFAIAIMLCVLDELIAFLANEKEVQSIARTALSYQLLAFCLVMPANATNMLYQACNKPIVASILAALRQGFVGIPLLIILSNMLGEQGMLFVQPIADVMTTFISICFAYFFFTSSLKKALQS